MQIFYFRAIANLETKIDIQDERRMPDQGVIQVPRFQ
jgi:hypothetical protein